MKPKGEEMTELINWANYPAPTSRQPDAELADSFARHVGESLLPLALEQPDPLLVFASLGRCIQGLAEINASSPAEFLRQYGPPEWSKVSIDRQNLADRVSEAWVRSLKSGDEFCAGHGFPGKEKDLVIESRHPGARGSESRTQTRAVFNTHVLIDHLQKTIRVFLARLASPERESAWVDTIRRLHAPLA